MTFVDLTATVDTPYYYYIVAIVENVIPVPYTTVSYMNAFVLK
jgi:hypothetical protein